MKKIISTVAAVFCATMVFAYNPPVGGQSLFLISNPDQFSGGNSACGGAIFAPGPDSIAFNPALPAMEDRTQMNADFSALISTVPQTSVFNPCFDTGILIPLKMFTVTGLLNGDFCNADEMNIGNTINFRTGLSKSVTERISVGLNLYTGFLCSPEFDWALGADVGFLYRIPRLGFLKDTRIGVSVLNLGKNYSSSMLPGLYDSALSDLYPCIATLKTGVASLLMDVRGFKIGASFDVTVPAFQNLILDAGLQFGIKDIVYIKVAENFDISEVVNGHTNFLPSVGLSVKFNFNATNNEYLKSHSWDKSEMIVSGAWQQKYETLQAISGGVRIKLGQKDTVPPVIKLWDDDDEVMGL